MFSGLLKRIFFTTFACKRTFTNVEGWTPYSSTDLHKPGRPAYFVPNQKLGSGRHFPTTPLEPVTIHFSLQPGFCTYPA